MLLDASEDNGAPGHGTRFGSTHGRPPRPAGSSEEKDGRSLESSIADETFEYPLVAGVEAHPDLLPLDQINQPDIDLANVADLAGTLRLMRDVGVLERL